MKPTLSALSCLMLKQASLNPQLLAALVGGGAGALAGGAVQGVRKLTQSRDDEERDGSPSVLKGMLLGGLGGAGLGYGAERMLGAGGTQASKVPGAAEVIAGMQPEAPGTLNQAPNLAGSGGRNAGRDLASVQGLLKAPGLPMAPGASLTPSLDTLLAAVMVGQNGPLGTLNPTNGPGLAGSPYGSPKF